MLRLSQLDNAGLTTSCGLWTASGSTLIRSTHPPVYSCCCCDHSAFSERATDRLDRRIIVLNVLASRAIAACRSALRRSERLCIVTIILGFGLLAVRIFDRTSLKRLIDYRPAPSVARYKEQPVTALPLRDITWKTTASLSPTVGPPARVSTLLWLHH